MRKARNSVKMMKLFADPQLHDIQQLLMDILPVPREVQRFDTDIMAFDLPCQI
jgi:hypothetical protein